MKRNIIFKTLIVTTVVFLCGECHPGIDEDIPRQTASQLIVKAVNEAITTRSTDGQKNIVFTGDDILWFNENTREIRFRDNASNKDNVLGFQAIQFYINDEYLFPSMTYASGYSSQIYNSLVFYYNTIENKFYLVDGYPVDVSVLSNPQKAQEIRDENAKKIESEWNRFIEQMKKEERYKN
jgi:hypothetical protein